MKLFFSIFLCSLFLFPFSSCTKTEGPGGSATIKGHVRKLKMIAGQAYYHDAADEDVYLIYGNEGTFYDDDVKTSYDGSFEFNYLQTGNQLYLNYRFLNVYRRKSWNETKHSISYFDAYKNLPTDVL